MARGFGTTFGVGITDKILTNYTASNTGKIAYSMFFYKNSGGTGGGGLGRFWIKQVAGVTLVDQMLYDNGGSVLTYMRGGSVSNSTWSIPAPAQNAWHHLVINYDAGSIANAPTMYLDGVLTALTVTIPAVGTLNTNTDAYIIGNTNAATRNWEGKLAGFAVWNGFNLTQAEVTAIFKGIPPFAIRPSALSVYLPLYGNTTNERDWSPHNLGAQIPTGTLFGKQPREWPILMAS